MITLLLVAIMLLSSSVCASDEEVNIKDVDVNDANPEKGPPGGITAEIFSELMSSLPQHCREAIESNPSKPEDLSEDCQNLVQTTLQKLLHPQPRDPNNPVTPEIFAKMMDMISKECAAEIEANREDPSAFSDSCKQEIQTTLKKLIPRESRLKKTRNNGETPDGDQSQSKKQSFNSGKSSSKKKSKQQQSLMIVLAFVMTAIAGIGAYAYSVNKQKEANTKKTNASSAKKHLRKQKVAKK